MKAFESTAERALKSWPSRNLEQLFDDLAQLGERWRAGEAVRLPRVLLHLRSGQVLTGLVLDVHVDRHGGRTVLLRSVGTHQKGEFDVTHVPWASIEALTVQDVASYDKPPEGTPAPPTRLELERRVAAAKETIAERVGTPIALELELGDEEERTLEPLDWLLRNVEEALLRVTTEPTAADAVRGKVRRVRLLVGMQPLVVFADGVLSITTPVAWNKRGNLKSLQRELEAVL